MPASLRTTLLPSLTLGDAPYSLFPGHVPSHPLADEPLPEAQLAVPRSLSCIPELPLDSESGAIGTPSASLLTC